MLYLSTQKYSDDTMGSESPPWFVHEVSQRYVIYYKKTKHPNWYRSPFLASLALFK